MTCVDGGDKFLLLKKFLKNLKSFCGKKTLSNALGFEPRSFDCRSTALSTKLHRHPTSSPQEDLLISPGREIDATKEGTSDGT